VCSIPVVDFACGPHPVTTCDVCKRPRPIHSQAEPLWAETTSVAFYREMPDRYDFYSRALTARYGVDGFCALLEHEVETEP
jgi:hypothetical protein